MSGCLGACEVAVQVQLGFLGRTEAFAGVVEEGGGVPGRGRSEGQLVDGVDLRGGAQRPRDGPQAALHRHSVPGRYGLLGGPPRSC